MSFLTDLYQKALGGIQKTFAPAKELISPIPQQVQAEWDNSFWDNADLKEANQAEAQYGGKPAPAPYRISKFGDQLRQQNPKNFEALESGTRLAQEKYGFPADLNFDIALLESGGVPKQQHGGAPGSGYHQYEQPYPQDLQRIINKNFDSFDTNSATDSAMLTALLGQAKQLSRWGTQGGNWGTLDNVGRRVPEDRISTYYGNEELNPYLSEQFQFK